jgi:DNA-directed RNA polymerase beta' subunit
MDIQEIDTITLSIYSAKEILDMSVCEITNAKKSGPGSVYDERMGTTDSSKRCVTCDETAEHCQGHFGHIVLNEPVQHPLYYKRIIEFLNCFCFKCNRLRLLSDQLEITGLSRFKGEKRFVRIQEKLKKEGSCCHPDCRTEQPVYKFVVADQSVIKVYETRNKERSSIQVPVSEIFRLFDQICDEDVRLLGFDPALVHPRNLIITVLPVLPQCDRPYVVAAGNICDDDITNQLIDIVKINNQLSVFKEPGKEFCDTRYQKLLASLRFRIHTTFNNSHNKAKHSTNSRPIKGIKDRLGGKDGQLRGNIFGRRCNQTGRTVIGPDPTLRMGELAVPEIMAKNLTIPVRATKFNLQQLQKLVDSGKVNSLLKPDGTTRINLERFKRGTRLVSGDVIQRGDTKIKVASGKELVLPGDKVFRGGNQLEHVTPANRPYELNLGWIVERQLQDGDYVLLNRQPTLHTGSMMAMKTLVKPGKTLRFNLACCKSFNSDFDKLCRKQGAASA